MANSAPSFGVAAPQATSYSSTVPEQATGARRESIEAVQIAFVASRASPSKLGSPPTSDKVVLRRRGGGRKAVQVDM